jgi:hypothetical protein
MPTHSTIAVKIAKGSYLAAYCHFDGYLDGVGVELLVFYNTQAKALELVEGGAMRAPGEHFNDDDDDDESAVAFSTKKELIANSEPYLYLFNKVWKVWSPKQKKFLLLETAAEDDLFE